jgi:hypothetical protein
MTQGREGRSCVRWRVPILSRRGLSEAAQLQACAGSNLVGSFEVHTIELASTATQQMAPR